MYPDFVKGTIDELLGFPPGVIEEEYKRRIQFYDPKLCESITETGKEIIRTTFGELQKIIPYEQLEDLMAHDLLRVEEPATPITTLLFLDIDGVLNCGKHDREIDLASFASIDDYKFYSFDDECMKNLYKILDELPECKIVLSSTWRKNYLDVRILRRKLGDYEDRIIASTPIFDHGHRGLEIEHYLLTNYRDQQIHMCILDDDGDFFLHQKQFFIQTDQYYGLTDTLAYRATQILKKHIRTI
jgi:hypothetical protein